MKRLFFVLILVLILIVCNIPVFADDINIYPNDTMQYYVQFDSVVYQTGQQIRSLYVFNTKPSDKLVVVIYQNQVNGVTLYSNGFFIINSSGNVVSTSSLPCKFYDYYDNSWHIQNNYAWNGQTSYYGGGQYRVQSLDISGTLEVYGVDKNKIYTPTAPIEIYENYYIRDEINLFNGEQKNAILEQQKKWEINDLQFFVLTYIDNGANNQQRLLNYANQKSKSGHGSVVVTIGKKQDGSLICGFAISRAFAMHGYFGLPHIRYANDLFFYFQREDIRKTLSLRLNSILHKMIYEEKEHKEFLWGLGGYIGQVSCKFYEKDTSVYALKFSKLPYCNNKKMIIGNDNTNSFINEESDIFGWKDENYIEYHDELLLPWDNVNEEYLIQDDNHVWFSDIFSVPVLSPTPTVNPSLTPTPTLTPLPYKSPIPTNNNYTPIIEYNPPPGGGIDWPGVTDEVYGKLPVGLIDSLYRINELKTTPVAPVFKLNFNYMISGFCTQFQLNNPFPNEETVVMDFSKFNDDIKLGGIGILTFFRTLISSIIIFLTLLAIKDRLIPSETIK